jgi:hypothetical protein
VQLVVEEESAVIFCVGSVCDVVTPLSSSTQELGISYFYW